nr:hypothetical protein SPBC19G7.12c - fission yeast (Schizosaccharomyces pombe) [Schizosaccharomyces pombe]
MNRLLRLLLWHTICRLYVKEMMALKYFAKYKTPLFDKEQRCDKADFLLHLLNSLQKTQNINYLEVCRILVPLLVKIPLRIHRVRRKRTPCTLKTMALKIDQSQRQHGKLFVTVIEIPVTILFHFTKKTRVLNPQIVLLVDKKILKHFLPELLI